MEITPQAQAAADIANRLAELYQAATDAGLEDVTTAIGVAEDTAIKAAHFLAAQGAN